MNLMSARRLVLAGQGAVSNRLEGQDFAAFPFVYASGGMRARTSGSMRDQ